MLRSLFICFISIFMQSSYSSSSQQSSSSWWQLCCCCCLPTVHNNLSLDTSLVDADAGARFPQATTSTYTIISVPQVKTKYPIFTFIPTQSCKEKEWNEIVDNSKKWLQLMQRKDQGGLVAKDVVQKITQAIIKGHAQMSFNKVSNARFIRLSFKSLSDSTSPKGKSVLIEHFSELPNFVQEMRGNKFYQEQTEETLEAITNGLREGKIISEIALAIQP